METLTGIGKIDRQRIAAIICGTKGTISVDDAAQILKVESTDAAKMLSRWSKKGWVSHIKLDLTIDESLEESENLPDPDILAQEIVEDLEAALKQFREIADDLNQEGSVNI